ncbi:MAG: DUF4386 domain-containing protein [Vicinamibacteria bacterium]|nr:DUF4386 domain-containing protein [Vicinamibacteria bacterium]
MEGPTRAGRLVGLLILLQMTGSALVNGVLEAPLFGSPGFLVNAAPHFQQIGLAAILGVASEALWLGIAVSVFALAFPKTPRLALGLLALAAVLLAAALAESAGMMSMVSLSDAYGRAEASERPQIEAVRVAVASARNWAHFLAKVMSGATLFLFYAMLYRCSLAPRAIAALGLIAAPLMMLSVGRPLFGYAVLFPMLAPMGLSQLILSLWLLARGFPDEAAPRPA